MANRKVVLVRLCKTEKGWRRYPAVVGKNGRIKPGFVKVAGKEREYREGRYQLCAARQHHISRDSRPPIGKCWLPCLNFLSAMKQRLLLALHG
jgi:hypothetical protein